MFQFVIKGKAHGREGSDGDRSLDSYRGPGLERGLEILGRIKREFGVPILTDVHMGGQVGTAAEVCDIFQIPAFLSPETDLLLEVGRFGAVVNINKSRLLSAWDIRHAIKQIRSTGNNRILVTERSAGFGYNNLVVDRRGLAVRKECGFPVILRLALPTSGQASVFEICDFSA